MFAGTQRTTGTPLAGPAEGAGASCPEGRADYTVDVGFPWLWGRYAAQRIDGAGGDAAESAGPARRWWCAVTV